MKTLTPREATLRDQFRQKLVDSSRNVFTEADLLQLAVELRLEQAFPRSLSERSFVRRIIQDEILKTIPVSATYAFEAKRYHYRAFTDYELALSLKPGGYLSHGTAALLHHLINHEPTIIYVNKEQSRKTSKGTLSQVGIDRAFSHKQRQSAYIVMHDRTQIVLLNGKNSNRLGVVKIAGRQGEPLEVTNVDRTLIDIVVRPAYAGGAKSVARAYRNALSQTSVSRLAKMLGQLGYVYPYHQTLGFYLQNAGHAASTLEPLRDLGLQFDFYLEHGMKDLRFDPTWRVHYPEDINAGA
jgi:predicted transcriptional regulator of viral defense system